jgi:DnaJ homologue, subfamily C, member 28, conserved domain
MSTFDNIAERRIREAQENGEFDDLPGAGAPLAFDDDALVPEELRAGYRLLKNAGFLPPELEAHQEIRKLEQLLETVEDEAGRSRLYARINFLLARRRRGNLQIESAYYDELAAALERRRSSR